MLKKTALNGAWLSIVLTFLVAGAVAQTQLPVIRANSRYVSVRNGINFKKDVWYILPQVRPDTYYTDVPRKSQRVTFYTDLDSISFNTTYGASYDFIILLGGKDSCYTRISSTYKKLQAANGASAADTIPFTLGSNDKIYLQGRLNGAAVRLQFDMGCGGALVAPQAAKKAHVSFDGTANLMNNKGQHKVRSSGRNILQLGKLQWQDVSLLEGNNLSKRDDGIVGNILFQDKIIELDYERLIMIVRDTLPTIPPCYTQLDMTLGGVIPFIKGSFTAGNEHRDGLWMFDTGAYTSIVRSSSLKTPWSRFGNEIRVLLGGVSKSPVLSFGPYHVTNTNYESQPVGDATVVGLLGNDLLKRYNVIIDNRDGYIYIKPNNLKDLPYRNPERTIVRVGAAIVTAGTLLLAYFKLIK